MTGWLFSFHYIEKQLNADYTLPVKLNWKVFKFDTKICFSVHAILQLSGRSQFPTHNTKFFNSAVILDFSKSSCFQIWQLRPISKTFDSKIPWYHKVFQIIIFHPCDKNMLFLQGYRESTVCKSLCMCFGFGNFLGKTTEKK